MLLPSSLALYSRGGEQQPSARCAPGTGLLHTVPYSGQNYGAQQLSVTLSVSLAGICSLNNECVPYSATNARLSFPMLFIIFAEVVYTVYVPTMLMVKVGIHKLLEK